jgi:hypothetical protein
MACQFRGKRTLGGSEGRTHSRGKRFGWGAIVLFIGSHHQAESRFVDGRVTELVAHHDIESREGGRHA